MVASALGYTDIVTALIETGAELNTKEIFGRTALMWASYQGHTKIVELLKKAGTTE